MKQNHTSTLTEREMKMNEKLKALHKIFMNVSNYLIPSLFSWFYIFQKFLFFFNFIFIIRLYTPNDWSQLMNWFYSNTKKNIFSFCRHCKLRPKRLYIFTESTLAIVSQNITPRRFSATRWLGRVSLIKSIGWTTTFCFFF